MRVFEVSRGLEAVNDQAVVVYEMTPDPTRVLTGGFVAVENTTHTISIMFVLIVEEKKFFDHLGYQVKEGPPRILLLTITFPAYLEAVSRGLPLIQTRSESYLLRTGP